MLSEKTSMWKKSGKILQGKKDSWKQWCRKQSAARLIDVGKIVENNKTNIDRKWYLYWKQGEMKEERKKNQLLFFKCIHSSSLRLHNGCKYFFKEQLKNDIPEKLCFYEGSNI